MKILLIQPPKAPSTIGGEDVFIYEPLALEYLAAGVPKNHRVKILDMRLDKALPALLAEFSPDIIGITAYTAHVNVARDLFQQVKKWNPKILTVVGGHHATVMPEDFISPFIDLVVIGDGLPAFQEIISRFEKGETFEGIPGVCIAKENGLIKSERPPSLDLDLFPFPDRKLTAPYRKHYYSEWMKPLASIRTSKGCPFRCKFCAQWKVADGRYFRREPIKIVEELKQIEEEFVFFADDESLVDTRRMAELARLIKEAGIKKRYFLYGRSDTITRNPGLLKSWRDIGLERIFVGFEFVRDEDLAYIRKNSSSADNEKAVGILHDLGIEIYASFMVRPEFSHEDFTALKEYCRKLNLTFASFAVLTPLPGTDLMEEVKERMITCNYDYFDFIHTLLPTTLPLQEFYREYHDLYKNAIPLRKQLSMLRKFPLMEIPRFVGAGLRIYKQLRTIHNHYEKS